MTRLVEIATNVSTPLMVAGFLAAALFLILRQILKMDIFPGLNRQLGAEIIRLIIDRLFVLALVALVLGFAGFTLTVFAGTPEANPKATLRSNIAEVQRLNEEIAYRLQDVPHLIQSAREADDPIAKSNILNRIFEIPEAAWMKPLLPEFANRSVISLCYDLKSRLNPPKGADAVYDLFQKMAKDAKEKYYVHDMYKMDDDELRAAEDAAENFYNDFVALRSQ